MTAINLNLSVPTLVDSPLLSANSLQPSDQTSDFEKTLRDSGDKPVRKPAAHRPDSGKGGDQLPDSGNNPPVAAIPAVPPPISPVAHTVKPMTAVDIASATSGVRAAPPPPAKAALNTPAAGAAVPTSTSTQVAADTAGATAEGPAASSPVAAAATAADDAAPTIPAPTVTALADATPPKPEPILPVPASSTPAVVPGAATGSPVTDKNVPLSTVVVVPKTDSQIAVVPKNPVPSPASAATAATSAPSASVHAAEKSMAGASTPADQSSNTAAATTSGLATSDASVDATAQTQLAAALAAAAAGVVPPASQSAASSDSLATPATGVTPAGIASVAQAAGIAAAQPASAAAAASAAQVVIGAAAASADDKHTHTAATDLAATSVSNGGTSNFAQLVGTAASIDPAPVTLKVTAGVDTPEFAQGVGNQVSVMVDNNLNTAKLQVNPASLGPIEVSIAIQNGHAQVSMISHSAVTRDALEASTPKLKEMLSSQGFSQVSVDISQRSFQERTPQSQTYAWQPPVNRDASSATIQPPASSTPRSSSSVLDAYA